MAGDTARSITGLEQCSVAWREYHRRYGRRGISQRARRAFRKLLPREQLRHSIREIEAFDKWGLPEPEPHWLPVLDPKAPGYRFSAVEPDKRA